MTDFFTRFRTFFSCVLAVIIVAPVLAQSAVANEEGGALSGFGSVNSSELVDSGSQALSTVAGAPLGI